MKKASLCALLLVLLLLSASRERADARVCRVPSGRFEGQCLSNKNCNNICQSEGYEGGDCEGFPRRCTCLKRCS